MSLTKGLSGSLRVLVLCCIPDAAIAQEPTTNPAAIVFGPWASVFSQLDIVTILCVAVMAFWMSRSFKLSETTSILIPTALGSLFGVIEAATRLETGGRVADAAMTIFTGVMLNGAGATLVGRMIAFLMERWWPSPAGQFRKSVEEHVEAIKRGEEAPPPGVEVKVKKQPPPNTG